MSRFIEFHADGLKAMRTEKWWESLWSWEAFAVYMGWYLFCVVCDIALPGKEVQGAQLRNGKRLTYTMNGTLHLPTAPANQARTDAFYAAAFSTMMLTFALIGAWTYKFGPDALLYIPYHWPQLISAALAWSTFLVSVPALKGTAIQVPDAHTFDNRPPLSSSKVTSAIRCSPSEATPTMPSTTFVLSST